MLPRLPRLTLLLALLFLAGCSEETVTHNRQPTAVFTVTPEGGSAPLTVLVDASASRDPDGDIVAYEWSVSSGGVSTGRQQHEFVLDTGEHTLTLVVTDEQGARDSTDQVVVVSPAHSGIRQSRVTMDAITSTSIDVSASGAWEIETEAGWLSAHPSSGNGDGTVVLTADPTGLTPGKYRTTIDISSNDDSDSASVVFSFPRLSGSIRYGFTDSAASSFHAEEALPATSGRLLVGLRAELSGPPNRQREQLGRLAREIAGQGLGLSLLEAHPGSGVAVYEAGNSQAATALLRRNPNVRYVEPDRLLRRLAVSDPERSKQWNLDRLEVDEAWLTSTGAGVTVAVIDSGFHPTHPDLSGNVVYQYDFGDDRPDVFSGNSDCGTHGQHVSGIVAASTDNGEGVAGIAPEAGLKLLDVDSRDEVDRTSGACAIYLSSLLDALEWVAVGDSGPNADIVNMSLGTGLSSQALHDAVRTAFESGVTLFAAAGNVAGSSVSFPAAYAEVVAVSATGPSDELAGYSTTGPEVWLSAPGGNVQSASSEAIFSTIYDYLLPGPGYGYMQGTSMASPAAAGVAALVKGENDALSPCDISRVLAQSSEDLGQGGWDEDYGYGRIDAAAAVDLAAAFAASPCRFVLKVGNETAREVPVQGNFDLGYISPGSLTVVAGSDDNGNGVLDEPGEYFARAELEIGFDGPLPPLELVLELEP